MSVGSKAQSAPKVRAAKPPVTDIHDPQQLAALAKRLLARAYRFAATLTWWTGGTHALAKGNTVEDIACRAMVSLVGTLDPDPTTKAGKRRWDPKKYPDPFVYLAQVVETDLTNLAVSRENKPATHADVAVIELDLVAVTESPEALLVQAEVDAEHGKRVAQTYSFLVTEISGNAQLEQLHDLMFYDGITKPKDLAEPLAMSVADVYTLMRRMRRAATRARARFEKESTHV